MTAATMPDRLRQIAILISSVDSAAARQILLQLPTDTARQIRLLASRLGDVSADEKRRILSEFQRSAMTSVERTSVERTSVEWSPTADRSAARSSNQGDQVQSSSARPTVEGSSDAYSTGQPMAGGRDLNHAGQATDGDDEQSMSGEPVSRAAWTRLSTAALVRFVREERAAVTAVVVSQLAPAAAVEVLQHLPTDTRREVLLRLSGLQEIDPEAMQTIDEHLSQRLHEYQHQIQSELQNSRRIKSLLAAAPPELRSDWAELLGDTIPQPTPTVAQGQAQGQTSRGQTSRGQAAGDQLHWSQATPSNRADSAERTLRSAGGDDGDILPFRRDGANTAKPKDIAAERVLIQWEFEQILLLPATALAHLLSSTDSQTVLLALAGASPEFMKQFYRMLNRHDAKTLEARLQRIGPIQLRDVDAAQQKIVDNAARLRGVLEAGESTRQAA